MTAQGYWAHIQNTYYHIPLGDSDHYIPDNFNMPPAIPKLKNADEEEIWSLPQFLLQHRWVGVKIGKVNTSVYISVK